MRSEVGKGKKICIYMLQENDHSMDESFSRIDPLEDRQRVKERLESEHCRYIADWPTTIHGSMDEDYAVSNWPVVVKVDPALSGPALAECLRRLADSVEEGQWPTRE